MPFKPGQSGNPSGRPKGVKGKNTERLRGFVSDLLDDNMDKVKDDLSTLDPKDRIDAYLKMMEYALPKLARTELVGDKEDGFIIQVVTHSQDANNQEENKDT